jgi:hypothetical protein
MQSPSRSNILYPTSTFFLINLPVLNVFFKVDLRLSYHQIKIRLKDVSKTAFSTRYGLFEYLVMSFGLINALTHFMYLMNSIFMLELNKFIMVFIDNILIYSKSEEEHNISGLFCNDFVTPRVSNPHDYINHIFKRP